ncbi:MAG: hypothetical protein R2813_00975 [Flavobacteriales bacterium]
MKVKNEIIVWAVLMSIVLLGSCKKYDDLTRQNPSKEVKSIEVGIEGDCEQELVFVDPGMCGGMWFKNKSAGYIEVYGWKEDRAELSLREGDLIIANYEPYTYEGVQCLAMTEFESEFLEGEAEYQTVMLTCQSKQDRPQEGGHCGNSGFIFENEGLCSGKWFKDLAGAVYEVYELPENKFHLVVGETYYFEIAPFSKAAIIECEAISDYEAKLLESGIQINVVQFTKRH